LGSKDPLAEIRLLGTRYYLVIELITLKSDVVSYILLTLLNNINMKHLTLDRPIAANYDLEHVVNTICECAKLHGATTVVPGVDYKGDKITFFVNNGAHINPSFGSYLAVFYLLTRSEVLPYIDVFLSDDDTYITIDLVVHNINEVVKYLKEN